VLEPLNFLHNRYAAWISVEEIFVSVLQTKKEELGYGGTE
jgi:hypothetical protein